MYGHSSARFAGRATPVRGVAGLGHGLAGFDHSVEPGALAFLDPLVAEHLAHLRRGVRGEEGG
jgi:hypothetical protein